VERGNMCDWRYIYSDEEVNYDEEVKKEKKKNGR
jgi:hypothetical protein